MTDQVQGLVARAALDNLSLPAGIEMLAFSGFFIKKSPNCMRHILTMRQDGTQETIPVSPDEDEYEAGFPECEYYLDLEVGQIGPFDLDKAEEKLIWALDRLRLYKRGLLWGELYGVFDPKQHPAGISEVKRTHREGPYPINYGPGLTGLFVIEDNEVDSVVDFVDDLKNTPTDSFAVALRRFHLYFDRDLTQDRAIDLMIVLESMFSDDPQAIAYKIALRATCLIESDPHNRRALFDFLKRAYNERNTIVHGRDNGSWFEEKTYIPVQTNLESLEDIVRKSLRILLSKAQDGIILTPSNLDNHLFFNPNLY